MLKLLFRSSFKLRKVIFTEPEAEETRKVVLIDSEMDVDEDEEQEVVSIQSDFAFNLCQTKLLHAETSCSARLKPKI